MTKEQIIQLLKDTAGLDFGDRTVALHFTSCFSSVVGQLFRDTNQWSFYTKQITLTVKNRVAKLTVPIMQFAANSKGVVRIYPTGAEDSCLPDDTEFIPMPSYALHSGADANNISSFVFYVVTAIDVRFNKSLPKAVTELYADCVLEFSAYENTDQVPLPSGVAQMIVDATIVSLKGDIAFKDLYKPKA